MLGSWSFGDYFKKETIDWAYELLVEVWGLDKDRLYATYFHDDESDLEPDLEARDLWLKYLPASHVIKGNKRDNFWEMGETGPCGPCSEIHFDRIGNRNAADLVNQDDPDVLEIWNLVFMQYNRKDDGSLAPLPAQSVDTGMGFERIVSVIHEKRSNYDTPIFTPIFDEICKQTGAVKYGGRVGIKGKFTAEDKIDTAYRVVADHIRTLCVSITDGSGPGPVGRQYVVRRIMRRALRYWELLGGKRGGFCQLAGVVTETFGGFFPELIEKKDYCIQVIKKEEDMFARTLRKGTSEFKKIAEKAKKKKQIKAEDIWVLWSRFGFPPDLTLNMAEEIGYTADMEGYKILRSKPQVENSKGKKKRLELDANCTKKLEDDKIPITEDSAKFDAGTHVKGAKILAIWNGKEFVQSSDKVEVGVVLDKTNFYAEGGGQVADEGSMKINDLELKVTDTRSFAGYVLHTVQVPKGKSIIVGDQTTLYVNMEFRAPTMANHTCTHILNHALLTVLGPKVEQKGSLVDNLKLRFDFSCDDALTSDQIQKVEEHCCDIIAKNLPVYTKVLPKDTAMKIKGLRAVFANYPKNVRVVSVGKPISELEGDLENEGNLSFSIELCGGTHLSNTGAADLFVITKIEGISQGVRRATAVTGAAAEFVLQQDKALWKRLNALNAMEDGPEFETLMDKIQNVVTTRTLPAKKAEAYSQLVKTLVGRVLKLKKERDTKCTEKANKYLEDLPEDQPFIVIEIPAGNDRRVMSNIVNLLEKARPNVPGMVLSKGPHKFFLISYSPKGKDNLDCKNWVNAVKTVCNGKGGGRQHTAQLNGDLEAFDKVLDIATTWANENSK